MAEPRTAPSFEGAIYALVLAVAIIGALIAVAGAFGGDDDAPEASSPTLERARAVTSPNAPRREATDEHAGGVEIVEAAPARSLAGPDFVPDLPEVPDLANEPPPPRRVVPDDPRMAQLAVEMRILSRARELLAEHPAEALAVLRQHRRQHPAGVLREEREAFSIEALLMLEHVDEAERRYYEFRDDFPSSPFLPRLTELMQRPPHEIGAGGR